MSKEKFVYSTIYCTNMFPLSPHAELLTSRKRYSSTIVFVIPVLEISPW